jgi:hypothetical protein
MDHEGWQLWKKPGKRASESLLLRYGIGVMLPIGAVLVIQTRHIFADSPFFVFLGAVVLSALYGG